MRDFFLAIRAWFAQLVLEIRAARAPAPPPTELPTFAVKTAGSDEVIELPPLKVYDHPPTPEEHRAEGRRMAHAYAEKRAGKPLTWKQAKLLLDKWEKLERIAEREQEREDQSGYNVATGLRADVVKNRARVG